MSALGQKQTLADFRVMSALPPKADIGTQTRNVCFVPSKADILGQGEIHWSALCQMANRADYSIRSSASSMTDVVRGYDVVVDFWEWYRRRDARLNPLANYALEKCEETLRKYDWDTQST